VRRETEPVVVARPFDVMAWGGEVRLGSSRGTIAVCVSCNFAWSLRANGRRPSVPRSTGGVGVRVTRCK